MLTDTRMRQFDLTFHHFGFATRDPAASLKAFEGLGYSLVGSEHDPLQGVDLWLCQHADMPNVELVAPSGEGGPLDNVLARAAERIYHLCYESSDVKQSLAGLRESGYKIVCVSPPKPAVLFGGRHVSFYWVKGLGLIELLERSG